MAYTEVRQLGSAACFMLVLGAHYDQSDYVSVYATWYNLVQQNGVQTPAKKVMLPRTICVAVLQNFQHILIS